jgi:protein translocase SecG subunit
MKSLILVLQIITAIILATAILVQVKGVGFGRVWGAAKSFSRRGLESLIFKLTFVVAALFVLFSILSLFT